MSKVEIKFNSVIRHLVALILCAVATHAQINSFIPDDLPENIQGTMDAPLNWTALGTEVMIDNECVDLRWEGFCGGGLFDPISVKFSYRLPVQVIENVRNVGETLLETPVDNFLRYLVDYPLFYAAIEAFLGTKYNNNNGLISIDENQQRRSGLRAGGDQRSDFGHSHIFPIPNDFTPLTLSWMPPHCTNWEPRSDFKNDTFPNIMYSRIPELTEAAKPGAGLVTPADCATHNIATGKTLPIFADAIGTPGAGVALAGQTCASAWGGKVYPLNAHTYAPNPYVGDALRSVKAIELAKFTGTPVYPFNRAQDRLKDFYNGSRCIRFGDQNVLNFPKESKDREQITHYVHYMKRTCCL